MPRKKDSDFSEKRYVPKSKSENNGSVAHPDSYREYSEADNGSVAQLYSASDFGSEGWGLESLRGHKRNPDFKKVGVFRFIARSKYILISDGK